MISEPTISRAVHQLLAELEFDNPKAVFAGIGIDVETNRTVDSRAARFFLSEPEQRLLASDSGPASAKLLLRIWTVKEAIFKADPDNSGRILADYLLQGPAAASGAAYRKDCSELQFYYTSFEVQNGFVAVAIAGRRKPHA